MYCLLSLIISVCLDLGFCDSQTTSIQILTKTLDKPLFLHLLSTAKEKKTSGGALKEPKSHTQFCWAFQDLPVHCTSQANGFLWALARLAMSEFCKTLQHPNCESIQRMVTYLIVWKKRKKHTLHQSYASFSFRHLPRVKKHRLRIRLLRFDHHTFSCTAEAAKRRSGKDRVCPPRLFVFFRRHRKGQQWQTRVVLKLQVRLMSCF